MSDNPALREVADLCRRRILAAVEQAVVGKRDTLELVLAGILAGGHVLLEDFPGLGKTLAARSFAQTLGLGFARAQFTPDLLPADLTGSFLYDQRTHEFVFRRARCSPNCCSPTRSTARRQDAVGAAGGDAGGAGHRRGRDVPARPPFHVLATANPIEYEGTYPLPEAQLDRFLLRVSFGYPDAERGVGGPAPPDGPPAGGADGRRPSPTPPGSSPCRRRRERHRRGERRAGTACAWPRRPARTRASSGCLAPRLARAACSPAARMP